MTARALDDEEIAELTAAVQEFARAACELRGGDVTSVLRLLLVSWFAAEKTWCIQIEGEAAAEALMARLLRMTVENVLSCTNQAARLHGARSCSPIGVGHG